ncbi:RNA polymerase II transcription elongation factor SpEAF [Collariella sp. IMI 366227]|nr:RNA polymerase II transcription elongation factor SpEAF [Collariella sp. IMI 366227]
MTELALADHPKLLRAKQSESRSIATSRKRKLRELWAVATDEDGIPSLDLTDADAPAATPAEEKFLVASDILRPAIQHSPYGFGAVAEEQNGVLGKPQLKDGPVQVEPKGQVNGIRSGDSRNQTLGRFQSNGLAVSSLCPYDKQSIAQAPPAPQLKLLAGRTRDKRRRSVPTVIFGKQPSRAKSSDDGTVAVSQQRPGQIPTDDYFTPLFIEGFTRQSTWMKPIEKLLNQAHKTISTSDQYISILDHQACKILRRVYHLQQHDKWSLRQPVRCPEPTRPASHQDALLQEMKWMRTDFREERKWKRAVARNLANTCAEWVRSDPAGRLALQVNAVIPPRPADGESVRANAGQGDDDEALPDLIQADSPLGTEEELPEMAIDCVAPSAIFALQDDEVVFSLQPSKTADLLLENLPLYGSPLSIPRFDVSGTDYDPDASWKRPAVPLSKYVEGEMVLANKGPPRKRRRFDYLAEDEGSDGDEVIFGSDPDSGAGLQAQNTTVALFSPEMKGIRDRLHAGHQFRPPTEHPMPPQTFFESRTASQWTWPEDEQLKNLVRECSYNWSMIASMVATPSLFASGAERRTPWECFERWVSLGSLEGLPNDMARTPYFKAYQARIDAAQRTIAQQNQNAQQQVGPNGAVTPVPRRRPTTSVRVERRRNQKHLALIDAMRKLAKKRETAAQKAQHAANLAAMRKANEVPRQQIQNKTPRDYSIMRWERDQALAERMAAYALRQSEVNARRLQTKNPGQVPGTPGAPAAQTAAQIAAANSLNAARLNVPGQLAMAAAVQNRAPGRVSIPTTPGAVPAAVQARLASGLVPPLQMAGIPQAQLQAMQAAQAAQQHRLPMVNPQPDINLMLQARSIQNQQRVAIQQLQQQQQAQQQTQQGPQGQQQQPQPQPQQAAQQHMQQVPQQQQQQPNPQAQQMPQANGNQGSPTPLRNVVNGLNQGAFLTNAQAMMASFNAANGAGLVGSPGAGLSMPTMPGRSPGGILSQHITQRLAELEAHYRAKNPNLPPETVRQLATEHLGRMIVQSQQQAAMNAAAGAVPQQPMNSPHQYASLLRAQQQAQAQQAAQQAAQQQAQQQAGLHQRQASGSATPGPGK